MQDVVIIGSHGNALDVLDALEALPGSFALLGFLDDARPKGEFVHGFPILGSITDTSAPKNCVFVNAIGSPKSFRRKPALIDKLGVSPDRFATVVHPSAVISPSARIGRGTVILGNCTICANVGIGHHVMMLPNCVVGHDSVVEDFVTFAAGVTVSGSVRIGRASYLGAGSTLRDRISVGEGALLGMGAALVSDAPPGAVMAGVPARRFEERAA